MSAHDKLLADAGTVHRGIFDATIPPVIEIASGDTIEITTLSGNADDLPGANSGVTGLSEHRNVLAKVPPGVGAHFMTGPIAAKGAMPGDELIVEILGVELAQDWGWNAMKPGKGTLPDDFPQERRIHVAIDRQRGVVTMPWGLELKAAPFFGIIGVAPPPADGASNLVFGRLRDRNLPVATAVFAEHVIRRLEAMVEGGSGSVRRKT
jgi:acetamidase/formamidase